MSRSRYQSRKKRPKPPRAETTDRNCERCGYLLESHRVVVGEGQNLRLVTGRDYCLTCEIKKRPETPEEVEGNNLPAIDAPPVVEEKDVSRIPEPKDEDDTRPIF